MNEPEKPLSEHLKRLLKNSPTYMPPERFYQRVLERIEEKRALKPWFLSFPKLAVTACIVMITVIVARKEKEKEKEKEAEVPVSSVRNEMVSNPLPLRQLSDNKVANLRDKKNASPEFEKGDADLTSKLKQAPKPATGAANNLDAAGERAPAAAEKMVMRNASPALEDASTVCLTKEEDLLDRGCAPTSMPSAADEETPTEWTGTFSGISDRREVVIRNVTQWAALWAEHVSNVIPKPETPYIDFSHSMVVGVWTGNKPSTGYRVQIADIRDEGTRQRVIYREIAPGVGMMSGAAMTQPYILRIVPRSDDTVRFEIQPN